MTYLEIVNSVLKRLREAQVGSVAESTYSTLIGELVNEAKREVENVWSWSANSYRLSLSQQSDDNQVNLGSQITQSYDPQRSKFTRMWNASGENTMFQIDLETMSRYEEQQPLQKAFSEYWRPEGLGNELDEVFIRIWPTQTTSQTLYLYGSFPQRDLPSDGTEIKVSPYPVILGAYALAIAERGDDRGDTLTKAQLSYEQALADAIAIDSTNRSPVESDWRL